MMSRSPLGARAELEGPVDEDPLEPRERARRRLGYKTGEVERERLHADGRADHVAVDIDVARLDPPQLTALSFAAAVSLAAPHSAAAGSPFQRFVGEWIGGGQVIDSNGVRQRIRCRADFTEAQQGAALNQSIVCASQSYRIDISSYAEGGRGELGLGHLERGDPRRLGPAYRARRRWPLRGHGHGARLHRRGLARLERPSRL